MVGQDGGAIESEETEDRLQGWRSEIMCSNETFHDVDDCDGWCYQGTLADLADDGCSP